MFEEMIEYIFLGNMMALKRAVCMFSSLRVVGVTHPVRLASESVEGTPLPLQSVDDVHGGDGLPLGVFAVGDSITDDILEEYLQDTTGLLVDQPGDTLDTTTASQTTDGGLGYTLDVIPQHLSVTFCASFPQSLSSFTTARHDDICV